MDVSDLCDDLVPAGEPGTSKPSTAGAPITLQSHVKRFKCQFCETDFSAKRNCNRHESRCNYNKEKVANAFPCPNCAVSYSRKCTLNVHKKKCISDTSKPQLKKITPCLHEDCNLEFYLKTTLIEHIKSSHQDIPLKPTVSKTFPSINEFYSWKEKEEEDTFSYYTAKFGQATRSVKNFYCQHDGSAKVHSRKKTSRCNNKGRIKVGHYCIAKMTARVLEDKTVQVEYYPTHSHACKKEDMCHHPIPEVVSRFIDDKLADGVPASVVYDLTKEHFLPNNKPNVEDMRASILTRKRIYERERKRRMARRLHEDDAKAIYLLVTQLIESNDSSVLIYKPYGGKLVHGPKAIDNLPNSLELFMFAFQTDRQKELMNSHCNKILIVDETHGTNQYKYSLLTAMVVDDNRRGWPIAHLITSKSDANSLKHFFSCLKFNLDKDVEITCVITDDDPALINAMRLGISEKLIHLLCKWHVLKI